MFSNQYIEQVHDQLRGFLVKTPCLFSPHLSKLTEANVYLKLENMQKTGSFKERGALNFLLKQSDGLPSHVVTASAGNHAQAVALHAARLNVKATIFMPEGTANIKVLETERLNATVKLVGENYDEAYALARQFADETGARYLHAYNDPHVIAGQATVALEIYQQIGPPDAMVVPIGGGGLIAGISQFVANASPDKTRVYGVTARDFHSMAQALNKHKSDTKTIAEGIAVRNMGDLANTICMNHSPEFTSVTDREIQSAIVLLLERQKIVTEGAGAASVAAILSDEYRHRFRGKTVVVVISGGNIDISLLARLTAQEMVKSCRLCRMSLVIKDTPGSLSKLLVSVTKAAGNIVDIRHERSFANIRWNEVLVDVVVETKNEAHENSLLMALRNEGYAIDTYTREMFGA